MARDTKENTKLFIRSSALSKTLDISESTLWRWRKAGLIPKPMNLGPRIVGWRIDDIQDWLDKK